jgi:hypothetical protein
MEKIKTMEEVNNLEAEYCAKEEIAFKENPSDANKIAVLCKRDEFNRALLRKLLKKLNG